MVYIIGDTVKVTEAIDIFSYSPVAAGSYTMTYSVLVVGGTPTIPTLQVVSNTDVSIGLETDNALSGIHKILLQGTLNDAVASNDAVNFFLYIVKLEATLAD
mgnify:CR=1 FL=1